MVSDAPFPHTLDRICLSGAEYQCGTAICPPATPNQVGRIEDNDPSGADGGSQLRKAPIVGGGGEFISRYWLRLRPFDPFSSVAAP